MGRRMLLTGILLLAGGLAGTASALLGAGDPGIAPLLGLLALLGEGAGLVVLATAIDGGFARTAVLVAGVLRIVEVVLAFLPLPQAVGPELFEFAAYAAAAALILGAALLALRQDFTGVLRWALLAPGAATLLALAGLFVPLVVPVLGVLPEVAFAATGLAFAIAAGTRRPAIRT